MATIGVVGAGLGGLASALRLAKLGHQVTLVERLHDLGGAMGEDRLEGFAWDSGPDATVLPAVLRDLFRKTGRPLEREVDLEHRRVLREHRFPDGSVVALPGGSRAAQMAAMDRLGSGRGQQWADYLADYHHTWEVLRREHFERPRDSVIRRQDVDRILRSTESLARRCRRRLADPRLRTIAQYGVLRDGHDPRRVPAWVGLTNYLEQRFGCWSTATGMAPVTQALIGRLRTRGVTVLTDTTVSDLVVRGRHVVALATAAGAIDCDAVVCAIDPRGLPALAAHVHRTRPTIPPASTHLGLRGNPEEIETAVGEVPAEVVWTDPLLVMRSTGRAPAGHVAWTLLHREPPGTDPLDLLAHHGIDVAERTVCRLDRTAAQVAARWGSSPCGVAWAGRGTVTRRLGPDTPIAGVYCAGAHATSGSGVPFVGLSAALVAQRIGPART